MRDGKNGYAPSPGIPEAIEAVRGEAARKGIENVQDVFITSGASEAVDICLTALLNPGDEILTPCPDYPLYSAVLAKLGIEIKTYLLNEDDAWQPDLVDLAGKITSRTRAIVLINPNNPTGSVCSRRMLERIAELARRHNLMIFSDEIYDKLMLDGDEHISMAAVAPDLPVVTFGGISKNYLAPGWRLGWGIVSGEAAVVKPYVEGLHRLLRARLSANHPEQYAIKVALEGPQDHLIGVNRKLRERRDLTMKACNSIPRMICVAPRGAFYVFPRIGDTPKGTKYSSKNCSCRNTCWWCTAPGLDKNPAPSISASCSCRTKSTLTRAYTAIGEFMQERYHSKSFCRLARSLGA